jgi:hypothetical protein
MALVSDCVAVRALAAAPIKCARSGKTRDELRRHQDQRHRQEWN